MKPLILLLLLAIVSPSLFAHPQQALVPGGIALLQLPNYTRKTQIFFNGKHVAVFAYKNSWVALAGIGLKTRPGDYAFSIHQPDGLTLNVKIHIKPKKYRRQYLSIKNKREVNPNKKDMLRIIAESKRKKKAKHLFTKNTPRVNFIWPVTGPISSIFGLRRFFNGQERRPHNGLDIAVPEGTPIKAAADGTVIDAGNFFFSGNMIFINHGEGIISLYAHLSKINVKPGDKVKQGDIIGEVGHTGRATGPHLHFAVIANQVLIDPVLMLPKKITNTQSQRKKTNKKLVAAKIHVQ